jgi:hypothetical protein
MGRGPALFVALLMAVGIARALIRGDAAAGEGLSREDEPLAYWGIIGIGSAVLVVMLYTAWNVRS